MRRVVITGIGAVSPNGIGREAFWEATRNGVSGVRRITRFDIDTRSEGRAELITEERIVTRCPWRAGAVTDQGDQTVMRSGH